MMWWSLIFSGIWMLMLTTQTRSQGHSADDTGDHAIAAQYKAQKLAMENYPMSSLKCMSSLTKPDMKLICPAARSTWCVKEVSNLRQDLCGHTQFFGDMWVNAVCEFKKCSDVCVPGTTSFSWGNNQYQRKTFCCNDKNFCNSSSNLKSSIVITSVAVVVLVYVLGL